MSTVVMQHDVHADVHHDDRSFIRRYIFSTDHKVIGIQFLFMSLFFLMIGGALAMMMRWQLGFPNEPMPGGTLLGPSVVTPDGVMLPELYNASVTMHGTIMVFFAIMPLLVGVRANYLIPLQIGAEDMAFPPAQHVVVLAGSAGWYPDHRQLLRGWRRRQCGVDRVRAALYQ